MMLRRGNSYPAPRRAQRMRTLASLTAAPAMPTKEIPGMPPEKETSTVTGWASTPRMQAAWMHTVPPLTTPALIGLHPNRMLRGYAGFPPFAPHGY